MLTQSRLKERLHYDPVTGVFTWLLVLSRGSANVGDVAGTKSGPYVRIGLDGQEYEAHRLAWLYMTGEWPAGEVDHKDTNGRHNAWDNLRDATVTENHANSRLSIANTSGLKGASFDSFTGRWRATIRKDRRHIHIGRFDTAEEAHLAYVAKARELFGEFARAS